MKEEEHEPLVNALAFDGKTTGPEAAVAVLQAENKLRLKVLNTLVIDAPPGVQQSSGDMPTSMTVEEKRKAEWDKSAETRAEFAGNYETYLAYHKDTESVNVRTITNRG